jgi:hypothetical protein
VSEAIKIHPSITKSDALVIYDRDNVMVDPTLYIRMSDALIAQSNFPETDIWSVVVERKHKVGEIPVPRKRNRKLKPIIIEYVKGDSLI